MNKPDLKEVVIALVLIASLFTFLAYEWYKVAVNIQTYIDNHGGAGTMIGHFIKSVKDASK